MALIKRDAANSIEEVVLRNTGYKTKEELNGKSFYGINFLKEAADLIKDAIRKKKIIYIFGDYDADGVCSTGTLTLPIESLGGIVVKRLPRRFTEGFGLSEKAVDEMEPGSLLITVDNGIVAFDAVKKARDKGIDVIVTDHHLMDESGKLPDANIIIDPHIPGTADFDSYCGAGIAYKLAKELTDDKIILNKVSCFAAIGTIADVMPLIEENRQIVIEGLKNMVTSGKRTSGLASILYATELDRNITETDVAFKIGPIINACGRLEDDGANIALEALLYDGIFKSEIGEKITAYNEERKGKVKDGMEAVYNNIANNCLYGDCPLIVYEPSIPEGIVGIIAGRLAEEKNVPTFVFTDSLEPGIYKGSGRTAGGIHLKNLLDKCSEMLYKYGGHAEAAGVSVASEKFYDFLYYAQDVCPELDKSSSDKDVFYDLEIEADKMPQAIEELKKFAPFGEGNPKPTFLVKNFQLSPRCSDTSKTMGDKDQYLKLFGIYATAVVFENPERFEELSKPQKLNLIGVLSENHFMGRTEAQIEVQYMEAAKSSFQKSLLAQRLEAAAKTRH